MKRIVGLFLIMIYSPTITSGQTKGDSNLGQLDKKVSKILSQNEVPRILKDSIALYTHNIIIKVKKAKNRTSAVLSVSDSILFDYFPNIKELTKIDFVQLSLKIQDPTIIIPILIVNKSATAPNRVTRQEGHLFADMQLMVEEFNKMLNSFVTSDLDSNARRIVLKPFIIEVFKTSKR